MSAVAHINEYKTGKFYRDDFRGDISWNGYEHNVLLRNEGPDSKGALQFSDVAMATGADDIRDARGTATGDFDNDGDVEQDRGWGGERVREQGQDIADTRKDATNPSAGRKPPAC